MKFQTSTEGIEIYTHLKEKKLLKRECEFMCYSDGMFNYHLKIAEDIFYEIIFEVDGDLFPIENLIDLLNKQRLGYFSVVLYDQANDKDPVNIGIYNNLDIKHLN